MNNDNKIAVSCPTEDEFQKVQKKAFGFVRGWSVDYGIIDCDNEVMDCVGLYTEGFCSKEYYEREDYTIISASDYLAYGLEGRPERGEIEYTKMSNPIEEGRAFEVGDRVENIDKKSFGFGVKGVVTRIKDNGNLIEIETEEGKFPLYFAKKFKLITPEHTVPLRVDDRVRVVGKNQWVNVGVKGKLTVFRHGQFSLDQEEGNPYWLDPRDLELIPTEADITVGSVWENEEDGKVRITDISLDSKFSVKFKSSKGYGGAWELSTFRDNYKLIHRGDGEVKAVFGNATSFDGVEDGNSFEVTGSTTISFTPQDLESELIIIKTNKKEKKMEVTEEDVIVGSQWTSPHHYGDSVVTVIEIDSSNDPRFNVEGYGKSSWIMSSFLRSMQPVKTNKKGERKMKKAEKVAKVGMLVVDRDCSNNGRIEAIYIEQNKVTYTDLGDNSIHTVNIDRLFIPVVMPKVKETKKKGKKKGRGK